jgi:hypothetical protein
MRFEPTKPVFEQSKTKRIYSTQKLNLISSHERDELQWQDAHTELHRNLFVSVGNSDVRILNQVSDRQVPRFSLGTTRNNHFIYSMERSSQPTSRPYAEPVEFSPQPHTLFL